MDLGFFSEFINVVAFGICLCAGSIIKNVIKTDKINAYIPLIVGILGTIIVVWSKGSFTPEILLSGLFSGLASTGCYEAFNNLIFKKK